MAGCGPCPDSCNCQVADELGVLYPGSGDAGSPIIVPRAIPETVFAATSSDTSISITPAGAYGHSPDLVVNVCAILEEAAERQNGRLVIFSNDADCKPERLRNPATNEYLGYDPVSGQATWLTLPTDFSITIDPDSTAPVSYGPNGLRVDCCELGVPEIVPYTAFGTFDKADYPGLTAVRVRVQGAGGGSGGIASIGGLSASSSGSGGGGGYSEKIIPVASLAVSETVTVGAGGSAGAATPTAGGTGDTSSFGAHATATGGGGGAGSTNSLSTVQVAGGAGGVGASGNVNVTGGRGGAGRSIGDGVTGNWLPTAGGDAMLGGAQANASAASSGHSGVAGVTYGGGAGGAASFGGSARLGAVGANGIVIVEPIYGT